MTALRKYWKRHPPVGWFLEAYFKYKPPVDQRENKLPQRPSSKSDPDIGTPADLAKMFGVRPGTTFVG